MTAEHHTHRHAAEHGVRCIDCGLRRLCLPLGLGDDARERFESAVLRRRALDAGRALYRAGDPLRAVYAIRSGSIKSSVTGADGDEQVTGFHLPAEILGFDAFAQGRHPCSAVALERSWICELSLPGLRSLVGRVPKLHERMLEVVSGELYHAHELAILRRTRGAGSNLAALLLSLSRRHARLGRSAAQFRLSMPRRDIASYLGVAAETVSRLMAHFQQDGLVTVRGRQVRLRDLPGLREAAGVADPGALAS